MKSTPYESIEESMKNLEFDFSASFTNNTIHKLLNRKQELQLWDLSYRWMMRAAAAVILLFGVYAAQQLKKGELDALVGVEELSFYDWSLLEETL